MTVLFCVFFNLLFKVVFYLFFCFFVFCVPFSHSLIYYSISIYSVNDFSNMFRLNTMTFYLQSLWKNIIIFLKSYHNIRMCHRYICKTQIDDQSQIDVQSSNRRPILKYMAVFHFLISTSNDVTAVYFKWRHTRFQISVIYSNIVIIVHYIFIYVILCYIDYFIFT
jgi:hypothetical protein